MTPQLLWERRPCLHANTGSNLSDVYKPCTGSSATLNGASILLQNPKDIKKTSVSSEQITTDWCPSFVA